MGDNRKVILIDGNSLVFRAYYALPPMMGKDGKQVNAIYGFFNMLLHILEEYDPKHILVAFDVKGPTFRKQKYDAYKGTRKETPQELLDQFPMLRDALDRLGIKNVGLQGYEADDIIGTMSLISDREGHDSLIYTGDRDSLQLISDHTHVMMTKRGTTDVEEFDREHLKEVYQLEPLQIIDLKGLMGDASDNIPGIAGVGEKTALKLLMQYPTVEELYEHIDELPKNKLHEKLVNGKDMAFFSKELATIFREVPLGLGIEDIGFSGLDDDALYDVLSSFGFKSIIGRLGLKSKTSDTVETIRPATEQEIEKILENTGRFLSFCLDEEKLSFAIDTEKEYEVVFSRDLFGDGLRQDSVLPLFSSVFADESREKILYDEKALLHVLGKMGMDIKGDAFDVMLAEYVINPTMRDFSLSNLSLKYETTGSAHALIGMKEKQAARIEKDGLTTVFDDIERPLLRVLYEMEVEGFRLDRKLLKELSVQYEKDIDALQSEIYELAGGLEFNISSTKQLGEVLFEKLGLPVVKKNKRGYSTDAEVLEKLSGMHPIIDRISEYRLLTKLKSTYIDGLENVVDDRTDKVHSTFSQITTATGRISSLEPNLQNIPVRSKFTSEIRRIFIPSADDGYIVAADYSQIELRILAHISQDAHMIDAFNKGEDIHTRTASEIFMVPREEVTSQMRSSAKAVNFGIVYGISDFGLARNLGIPRYKAQEYIAKYLSEFKGVSRYMKEIVEKAKEDGYVKTLYGRIRYIPELAVSNYNTRSFGERVALNTPIQGTAADIIKLAMIRVRDRLKAEGLTSKLISQVHDELIVDTAADEVEKVSDILVYEMEHIIDLLVPLKSNVAIGKTWQEAK
ncbi:MAG: DNA polymerase I [Clostridia bacterium]|nr:DNA polymerase I [Clostridia bacterium]